MKEWNIISFMYKDYNVRTFLEDNFYNRGIMICKHNFHTWVFTNDGYGKSIIILKCEDNFFMPSSWVFLRNKMEEKEMNGRVSIFFFFFPFFSLVNSKNWRKYSYRISFSFPLFSKNVILFFSLLLLKKNQEHLFPTIFFFENSRTCRVAKKKTIFPNQILIKNYNSK